MIQHTPGPWHVTDNHPQRCVLHIRTADDLETASVYNLREKWEEDARLIAAAPQMLEALKLISNAGGELEWYQPIARSAIAAATGNNHNTGESNNEEV